MKKLVVLVLCILIINGCKRNDDTIVMILKPVCTLRILWNGKIGVDIDI